MSCTRLLSLTIAVFALFYLSNIAMALPSYNRYTKRFNDAGIDFIQVCLNNCAQCKSIFGESFQAQNCAESCFKFKGKAMPDCEDVNSISQFLNRYD